jgi:hypothetical protein
MKCANCDSNAAFEYRLTLDNSIFYCDKDLPGFLVPRKKAGLLKITNQYKEDSKSAIEVLTLSIPETAEEVQADTSAPKKKKAPAKKSVK